MAQSAGPLGRACWPHQHAAGRGAVLCGDTSDARRYGCVETCVWVCTGWHICWDMVLPLVHSMLHWFVLACLPVALLCTECCDCPFIAGVADQLAPATDAASLFRTAAAQGNAAAQLGMRANAPPAYAPQPSAPSDWDRFFGGRSGPVPASGQRHQWGPASGATGRAMGAPPTGMRVRG